MKQSVKDFLAENRRLISCGHLHKICGGPASEGGDYDAAQRWLAKNGYRYDHKVDSWVRA